MFRLLLGHFEPLALRESHYTTMANLPTLSTEQRVYSGVAVASALACKTQNIGLRSDLLQNQLVHGLAVNASEAYILYL